MKRIGKALGIVLLGAVGAGLFVVGIHVYQDHKALHVLFAIESARQQAQQQPGK